MSLSVPQITNETDQFKEIYEKLSEDNGYFPIGANHRWHNGIHVITDEALHAIADGEVVAFRLAEDYYFNNFDTSLSNCFVLVKHSMTINDVAVVFFSLYINLLPAKYFFKDDSITDSLDDICKDYPQFIFKRKFKATSTLDTYETYQKKNRKTIQSGQEIILDRESDFTPKCSNLLRLDKAQHTGTQNYVDSNKYIRRKVPEWKRKRVNGPRERVAEVNSREVAEHIEMYIAQYKLYRFKGKTFKLDCMDFRTKVKDESGKKVSAYGLNVYSAPSSRKKTGFITNGSYFKFVDDEDFLVKKNRGWLPIYLDSIVNNQAGIKTNKKIGYIYVTTPRRSRAYRLRKVMVEKKTIDGTEKGIVRTDGYYRTDKSKPGEICIPDIPYKVKQGDLLGQPSREFNGFHFELIFSKETMDAVISGNAEQRRYFYYFNKDVTFYVKTEPVVTGSVLYKNEYYRKVEDNGKSYRLKAVKQQLWIPFSGNAVGRVKRMILSPITYVNKSSWNYRFASHKRFLDKDGNLRKECQSYMKQIGNRLYVKAFYDYRDKDSFVWVLLQDRKNPLLDGTHGLVTARRRKPYGDYRRLPVEIADIDENKGRGPEKALWVKDDDIKQCTDINTSKEELIIETGFIEIRRDYTKVYKGNPFAVNNKPDKQLCLLKNEQYNVELFDEAVLTMTAKKVYVWLDYSQRKEGDISVIDWKGRGLNYIWSAPAKFIDGTDIRKECSGHILKKEECINGKTVTVYYVKGYLDEHQKSYVWCCMGSPGETIRLRKGHWKPKNKRFRIKLRKALLEIADIEENEELVKNTEITVQYQKAKARIKMPEITEKIRLSSDEIKIKTDFSRVYDKDPLKEANTHFREQAKEQIQGTEIIVCKEEMSSTFEHAGVTWRGFNIEELSKDTTFWIEQDMIDREYKKDASKWGDYFIDKRHITRDQVVVKNNDELFKLMQRKGYDEKKNNWFARKTIQEAFRDIHFASQFKTFRITSQTEWSELQWCDDLVRLLKEREGRQKSEIENRMKNEMYKPMYWYDEAKKKIKELPPANEVSTFHPIHFIEYGRDFLPDKNRVIINYFKQRVIDRSGDNSMWKEDGVNIVAIRHMGQDEGERAARGRRHANDLWILIIDEEVKGFFLANTEPGVTVYGDLAARMGIACLIPGSYRYVPYISTENHRRTYASKPSRLSGFCHPEKDFPVWRDADGDGLFEAKEMKPAEIFGQAIQLHWMGALPNNLINGYSAGCQGIKGDYYIDSKGNVRHFLDSDYRILPELHSHGAWALFMKMVAGKVFSWGIEDEDGKYNQKYVYYHLFDKDTDNIDNKVIDHRKYVNKLIQANLN